VTLTTKTSTNTCATIQQGIKSNPNPNTINKQHAVVNVHLNVVTCPMYPEKFVVALFVPT